MRSVLILVALLIGTCAANVFSHAQARKDYSPVTARDHLVQQHPAPAAVRLLSDRGIALLPGAQARGGEQAVDGSEVPPFDDLPSYDDPAGWRYTALAWMRFAERFLLATAGLFVGWFAIRFLVQARREGAGSKQSSESSCLKAAKRCHEPSTWADVTAVHIRKIQLAITGVVTCVLMWLSIYHVLEPTSDDRLQRLVNLDAHPLASLAGALLPALIVTPAAYWLSGVIIGRGVAALAGGEVPWPRLRAPEPAVFVFAGLAVAASGFLLIDDWGLTWGVWGNVMVGKALGVPYRYLLLFSLGSVCWGIYGLSKQERTKMDRT